MMDIATIKSEYIKKLEEKCSQSFDKINEILIRNYYTVMNHQPIIIYDQNAWLDDHSSPWFIDMIKKIQQHYSENWDVIYEDKIKKEKQGHFVFTYKGDVNANSPTQESTVKESPVEEKDDEASLNRNDLIDL